MSSAAPLTWGDCLESARAELPRLEADVLAALAFDAARSALYAFPEQPAAPARAARLRTFVRRRQAGEPVAYILGAREFWSLPLRVDARALIPRPETEGLVAAALERLQNGQSALDLGAGCGAAALALAAERPQATILGVDASAACIALAQENARHLGLGARFRKSNWYGAVGGRFDVILSNPPYLAADDPHLRCGDLRFEPRCALVAGADALAALRRVVLGAPAHLAVNGWLLVEHGCEQGGQVRRLFAAAGLRDIDTSMDLAGRPRVTMGRNGAPAA